MNLSSKIELFLDSVRKSALIKPEVLDQLLSGLSSDDDSQIEPLALARKLMADGLLTKFQAEQLLQNRWRNFQLGGKYKILERISSGPMSSVFLCEHIAMKRLVALKMLPPAKAKEPASLARFQREARAAARLRHPNVVAIYDLDSAAGTHFLVAEYVDGNDLDRVVAATGPMTIARAADCIRQAAEGLQHAHEMGMVHRDIKPGNLLLDRSGTVKILDLGLARLFLDESDGMTQLDDGRMLLGTIDYLSPEQAVDSHDVDIRADIYSLGATAYFLLSGRSLFQGASTVQKIVMHSSRPAEQSVRELTGIPRGFADLLIKMMSKEPKDRFQTPAEVALAMAQWSYETPQPPSPAEMPRLSPACRRVVEQSRSKAIRVVPRPQTPVTKKSSMAKVLHTIPRWRPARSKAKKFTKNHAIAVGAVGLLALLTIGWSLSGGARDLEATPPLAISETPSNADSSTTGAPDHRSAARVSPVVLYRLAMAKLESRNEVEAAALLRRRLGTDCTSLGAMDGLQMTILDLYTGNLAAYRRDCQDMMAAFSSLGDDHESEIVLKCCMHDQTPVLLDKAKAIAARKFKATAHDPRLGFWTKTTLALLAIRADDLEESLEFLEEARPMIEPNLPVHTCLVEILTAIAQAKLENPTSARNHLEKARQVFETATANGTNMTMVGQWQDWYSFLILRKEAETLLKLPSSSR